MKGETLKKVLMGLAVAAALLFLLYAVREYGAAMYAESQTRRGVSAFEEGDVAGAERIFQAAVRINPKYAGAWLNLGAAARERGKHEKALDAFHRVLEITDDAAAVKAARLGLAAIYGNSAIKPPLRERDWYARAVRQYERLIEVEPGNPEYHMRLGFAAIDSVDPGRGFPELRRASELAAGPEHKWIHEKLLSFYQVINLRDEAGRELKIIEGFSEGAEDVPEEER
ncbi:tetratricopeptide repeat protein [bacterium]